MDEDTMLLLEEVRDFILRFDDSDEEEIEMSRRISEHLSRHKKGG